MNRLRELQAGLCRHGMQEWADQLPGLIERILQREHGDAERWDEALQLLPQISDVPVYPEKDAVTVGQSDLLDEEQRRKLISTLHSLKPWRKGPFEFFGEYIDTEWRSDWKWQRLARHLPSLEGKAILDVGCGNAYHCWRMAGMGADLVLGVDPSALFFRQFKAVQRYASTTPVYFLQCGVEDIPAQLNGFDMVFSMGVLYHRRSPIDHLQHLQKLLKAGGQLVLETLVVPGDVQQVLVPEGRYGKMRNVWFIPSALALEGWLRKLGYRDVTTVDTTPTTVEEQRATDWMSFESLPDFLDPDDPSKTIEGYPGPRRAIVMATS